MGWFNLNMSRYFEITFSDLEYDKQLELIESVAEDVVAEAIEEAPKYVEGSETLEEAYCRAYAIGFDYWEDESVAWADLLVDWAKKEAEEKLYKGFKHLEVEIEL